MCHLVVADSQLSVLMKPLSIMLDIIREAPLGQAIRLLTRNKFLQYPEEKPDFKLPDLYLAQLEIHEKQSNDGHASFSSAPGEASTARNTSVPRVRSGSDSDTQSESPSESLQRYVTNLESLRTRKSSKLSAPSPSQLPLKRHRTASFSLIGILPMILQTPTIGRRLRRF